MRLMNEEVFIGVVVTAIGPTHFACQLWHKLMCEAISCLKVGFLDIPGLLSRLAWERLACPIVEVELTDSAGHYFVLFFDPIAGHRGQVWFHAMLYYVASPLQPHPNLDGGCSLVMLTDTIVAPQGLEAYLCDAIAWGMGQGDYQHRPDWHYPKGELLASLGEPYENRSHWFSDAVTKGGSDE